MATLVEIQFAEDRRQPVTPNLVLLDFAGTLPTVVSSVADSLVSQDLQVSILVYSSSQVDTPLVFDTQSSFIPILLTIAESISVSDYAFSTLHVLQNVIDYCLLSDEIRSIAIAFDSINLVLVHNTPNYVQIEFDGKNVLVEKYNKEILAEDSSHTILAED